jgi:hypothetical protein
MKTKRIGRTTFVALIVAFLTLGLAPNAFANTWVVYDDNYTSEQTCENKGDYLLAAQPNSYIHYLDYFCQPSVHQGRWALIVLQEDLYGCFVAGPDMQSIQSGTAGRTVVPADC